MATGMILVAAGFGFVRTHDNKPVPKVIETVKGVPMIVRALQAAETAGIDDTVIVVNPLFEQEIHDVIEHAFHHKYFRRYPFFAIQRTRRGAADAVRCAIPMLRALGYDRALISYPDMPMWSAETFAKLLARNRSDDVLTMVTVERSPAYPVLDRYRRIVRDEHGGIARVVEVNDPTVSADILAMKHVNPSLWVFDLRWIDGAIPTIEPFRKSDGFGDELHMPPLISIATSMGCAIGEYALPASRAHEALGVNTLEELVALDY